MVMTPFSVALQLWGNYRQYQSPLSGSCMMLSTVRVHLDMWIILLLVWLSHDEH